MRTLSLALSLFVGCTSLSSGEILAQSFVSQDQVQRAGMLVNWYSQVRGTGSKGLVNTALVIDENKGSTFYEVKGGRLKEVVSETGIAPDGKPFKDQAAAEEYANIRLEVMQKRLEFEGSSEKASVTKFTLPKSTIYAMSHTGVVQAFDAETGQQLWQTGVGDITFPSSGVGASKKLVAAVNGSSVYCLDPETGKILWQKKCDSAVMGNPSASEEFIFVPLADGRMEIFDAKTMGDRRESMNSIGSNFVAPTVSGNVVAWGTDKGVLNIAPVDNMNRVLFRLRANGAIDAPATSKGNLMFVVSYDGFVYAFDKELGSLTWSSSLGEACRQSPFPIGDYLFVVTEKNHLFKFDSRNGTTAPGWEKHLNGIKQVIGASKDRLYVQTTTGQIQALDLSTGSRLGVINNTSGLTPVVNYSTDRIYLVSNSGVIECLRETASSSPFIHADEITKLESGKPKTASGRKAKPKNEDNNPFSDGVNSDRIETGNSDEPEGDKPSKNDSDDPFGGGGGNTGGGGAKKPNEPPAGGKENDDPFGGGGADGKKNDDPFGGG